MCAPRRPSPLSTLISCLITLSGFATSSARLSHPGIPRLISHSSSSSARAELFVEAPPSEDGQHTPSPTRFGVGLPSTANCTVRWLEQPLDHFSFATDETFQQRYYTYDKFWNNNTGPIFFYAGNEADVGLYVNHTGLIWEHAQEFGAYIIFAEHRYYGASLPTGAAKAHARGEKLSQYPYLSHELALADYAVLIRALKGALGAERSPVVAFGGSYGGKLAAWLRMKYPAAVEGAISASAPLLAFPGQLPPWNTQSYYQVVTNTAAHYSEACSDNVRAAFPMLDREGGTAAGRASLQEYFALCDLPKDAYKVSMLKFFIRDAFDEMAMGNYPYPSSYIAGTPARPMPAWPMQHACSALADPSLLNSPSTLFPALRQAVSVLYNVSGAEKCFDLPDYPTSLTPAAPMDGLWDWQWCTERLPDSYWFTTDGKNDMFWDNPYNATLIEDHCELAWGVKRVQPQWIAQEYGGRQLGAGHSNIVFSSGGFDGWSSAGVATNLSDTLLSIFIPDGGHHLDLMFSQPDDPPSVLWARELELAQIRKWVKGYAANKLAKAWGDFLATELR